MHVLIANERLSKRTGTEMAARDLAAALAARGHRVTLTAPVLGPLAEELRRDEGREVRPPEALIRPDLVHLNDLSLAAPLAARFPGVPMLLQWHRRVPDDFALPVPEIRMICGVTPTMNRKIHRLLGRPADALLGNYVDMSRFVPREAPLPQVPRRLLLVGQQKRDRTLLGYSLLAAARLGMRLSLVGPRYLKRVENLPAHARGFDIAIASGRCAMECLAAGAGLVLAGPAGLGGFVTPEGLPHVREGNFAPGVFRSPLTLRGLLTELRAYDAGQAEAAARDLREMADIRRGVIEIERLYHRMLPPEAQRA